MSKIPKYKFQPGDTVTILRAMLTSHMLLALGDETKGVVIGQKGSLIAVQMKAKTMHFLEHEIEKVKTEPT